MPKCIEFQFRVQQPLDPPDILVCGGISARVLALPREMQQDGASNSVRFGSSADMLGRMSKLPSNPSGVDVGLAIGIGDACRLAHQAAGSAIVADVVRSHRSCSARVPIPKFASLRGTLVCELRNRRDTSNLDSSAVLGFEVPTQTRGYNDRNFKSTALVSRSSSLGPPGAKSLHCRSDRSGDSCSARCRREHLLFSAIDDHSGLNKHSRHM